MEDIKMDKIEEKDFKYAAFGWKSESGRDGRYR